MKKLSLLSMAAIAALATEPVTIQKITIESDAQTTGEQKINADEMIKFSRQSDLGEMLSNTVPEITHVRNSAVGNDVILRGFRKDNLVITIDDAKVCGACPNTMDPPAMHISSAQIASIEVQEGPFDVTQFGSLGGNINVVTKDPQKGIHGEVSTTIGSFDYRKLSTTLEGGNDTIQALVGFSRETSGQYKDGDGKTLVEQTNLLTTTASQKYKTSYQDANAYERNNYWTKLVGNISNNQKLTFSYFGDRADDVLYPRYKMDAQADDTDMFNLKYQLFNLSDFSDELKVEGYHSKVTHVMSNDFRAFPSAMMNMVAPVESTIQGASLENTLTVANTKISIGFDGSVRNWNGTKFTRNNPNAVNILIPDVDTTNIALYAKASKNIGNYEINGGIRLDDTSIDAKQELASLDANTTTNKTFLTNMQDRDYSNISANLMTKYNLSPTSNVFLGIGQSVRVPDAKELYYVPTGNYNLKETKNREIDLGAEYTYGNVHIKGTAFYSDLKDYIYAYKSGSTTTWKNIDATITGFDLQTDVALTNEVRVDTGLAYQKGTKKDPSQLAQSDKDLAEIPPFKGRVALVFDNNVHYAMAEWIGAASQTFDADNGEKDIGGYGLLNLKYGVELGNGFSLMTGINNLFDRTYAVSNSYVGNEFLADGGVPIVLNEPGRNFYATVSYKF